MNTNSTIRVQVYAESSSVGTKSLLGVCSRSKGQQAQGLLIRSETIQYRVYSNIPRHPGLSQRSSVHTNTTDILTTITSDVRSAQYTDRPH